MNPNMAWEIIYPQAEGTKTLENFLKKRFPIGYVRKLFRKNGVRLNNRRAGPKEMAAPGDKILLFIPFEKQPSGDLRKTPSQKGFKILFEDDELLVIDKRAGIAVHEAKGILKRHTILGKLEAIFRSQGITPRLVHRIDKETSGLLLVAKKREVAEKLETKFEEGTIEKEYLALVAGKLFPKRGRIDFPLPGREGGPVPALTLYQVEREFPAVTLVRVTTKTGRTHQIRLHFAKLGHPVVMDDQHGDFAFNKNFRKEYGLKRQFLHASSIALDYHGRNRKWTAPLPDDLTKTLESLDSG
jgi:23S rRNA pseudouridine955/2504/2580 synthase